MYIGRQAGKAVRQVFQGSRYLQELRFLLYCIYLAVCMNIEAGSVAKCIYNLNPAGNTYIREIIAIGVLAGRLVRVGTDSTLHPSTLARLT